MLVTFRSPLQAESFFSCPSWSTEIDCNDTHFVICEISLLINDVLFFVLSYTFTLFCLTTHTTPHREHYAWFQTTFLAVPVILLSGTLLLLQSVAANTELELFLWRR